MGEDGGVVWCQHVRVPKKLGIFYWSELVWRGQDSAPCERVRNSAAVAWERSRLEASHGRAAEKHQHNAIEATTATIRRGVILHKSVVTCSGG